MAGEACVMVDGEGGVGAGQAGQLPSPDMKQAMLWVQDALRDIPDEVVKNCWQKVSILPFEVNQRYIEDKEKVSKGHAQMQKAADHLADLFGKLSIVFSELEEEAVREFDSPWMLTEEGMDALDALTPVVSLTIMMLL